MTNNIRLTTSATQIDQWLMCKRKWVAAYLLGLKQPQTEAMAFGEAGHKCLEIYNRTGVVPDETKPWQFTKESRIRYPGLSAKKALKHIPAPHTGRPEHGFKFVIRGIEFIGYIDLEWIEPDGNLWVTDYKFVSSFQSALAEDTLAANVQATIYATKAILEHKVKEVNLKWIYILSTAKPLSKPIITKLTEDQTKTQLRVLLDVCEEMIKCRDELQQKYGDLKNINTNANLLQEEEIAFILNSIEPTVESCSRYNGCFYCDKCQLTADQLMEGDMKDMDKSLEAKLKDMGLDQFIKPIEKKAVVEEEVVEATEVAEETETPIRKTFTSPAQQQTAIRKTFASPASQQTANNKQLNIDDFLKAPVVHKSEGRKEEPKVQLNAPENYMEEKKQPATTADTTAATTATASVSSCGKHFSLTDEEKRVLKGIIERL